MFGTQLDFMANSASVAYQSATAKTNAYLQQLQQTNAATGNQYQYGMGTIDATSYDAATIFIVIYKVALEQFS